ncbi:MAG: SCO family protein [Marmoricola sp.]
MHTKDDGFVGTVVKDPPLKPADVVLRDTQGQPYHLARNSPAKVTVLYFGFTRCNDVCPTTMADLAAARRAMPSAVAHRVQVVFVTVDPRRDTPRVLEVWLNRFDPSFVGLRGPTALVHEAERSLYADPSAIEPPGGGHHQAAQGQDGRGQVGQGQVGQGRGGSTGAGDYEVSHSGSVYVFGPGDTSLLYSGGTTATQYARDFAKLLKVS